MAQEPVSGKKYDHSNKRIAAWAFAFVVTTMVVVDNSLLGEMHRGHSRPLADFIALIPGLAVLPAAVLRRWQLTADALLDLRKRTKIPYASIEDVRIVKSGRNGAKTFAIRAAGETHMLDILQGDAFAHDLETRIGGGKLPLSN
jgi:hypothetical protein